jgi:hypothetical protein
MPSIGFRLHTGWAMLVAVGEGLTILHRCLLELLPPGAGRFVYHEAAELPLEEASGLIESTRRIAEETAVTAIQEALNGLQATSACLLAGSLVPGDLAEVLRSHARIHAAEGALYGGAIASACRQLKIPLLTLREREVWSRASASTGIAEADLRAQIDGLRKLLGPPWTADHKIATAAALTARSAALPQSPRTPRP